MDVTDHVWVDLPRSGRRYPVSDLWRERLPGPLGPHDGSPLTSVYPTSDTDNSRSQRCLLLDFVDVKSDLVKYKVFSTSVNSESLIYFGNTNIGSQSKRHCINFC